MSMDGSALLNFQVSLTDRHSEVHCNASTGSRTDMTKVMGAFCDYANAPKKNIAVKKPCNKRVITVSQNINLMGNCGHGDGQL